MRTSFVYVLGRALALWFCVLALACAGGCGKRPVTLGDGQSQFQVPAEYASSLSYPGLWGLSGGDDDSRSLAIKIPAALGSGRDLFGVLHVLCEAEMGRVDSVKSRVAQQINEGTGEFAGGKVLGDARLRGVRAMPANIDQDAYWYFLRRPPPGIEAADVIARCATDTPDRKHWSCQLDTMGKDFVVQITVPADEIADWAEIQDHVLDLVENWRVGG